MRLVNLDGRAGLDLGGRFVDLESRSGGRFGPDPMNVFGQWDEIRDWAASQSAGSDDSEIDPDRLGAPVPNPTQVFAIGLNYRDHAEEAGLPIPSSPMVFTKFPTCLVGPHAEVPLTSDRVDWEVELVVVIGREADRVPSERAWEYVAGLTVGQDISDRALQFSDKPPQFSLGKSAKAYGPMGPALVSLDEFANPDRLALRCRVGGDLVQESSTEHLIFPVAELIEYLSSYCVLLPGDVIFTGTPAGVGSTADPRRYLEPGETIESEIEGIGTLSNRCVAQD